MFGKSLKHIAFTIAALLASPAVGQWFLNEISPGELEERRRQILEQAEQFVRVPLPAEEERKIPRKEVVAALMCISDSDFQEAESFPDAMGAASLLVLSETLAQFDGSNKLTFEKTIGRESSSLYSDFQMVFERNTVVRFSADRQETLEIKRLDSASIGDDDEISLEQMILHPRDGDLWLISFNAAEYDKYSKRVQFERTGKVEHFECIPWPTDMISE